MFDFSFCPKIHITKIGLGSDGKFKQKWDPIKFVKLSNVIELSNDIDEGAWIDHNSPLAFDYFSTNNDILE